MRKMFMLVLFGLGVSATLVSTLNAELLYQPPPGTALDARWRDGASSLLEGIARIFDGLASIESKRPEGAKKQFDEAFRLLGRSSEIYSGLVNSIKSPRKIPIERLNDERRKQIVSAFGSSRVSLPSDEAAAAKVAADEVRRLLSIFEKERAQVISADLGAVQRLLSEVTRLQRWTAPLRLERIHQELRGA